MRECHYDHMPPVIRCKHDIFYQDQENVDQNDDPYSGTFQLEQLCHHLKGGAMIYDVLDNDAFTYKRMFTRAIILKHQTGVLSYHNVVKHQQGPLQSYYDADSNTITSNILTSESRIIFLKEHFQSQGENGEGVLNFVIFHIDLITKSWIELTHSVVLQESFGTHTITMNQSQLLISLNRPLKIFAFDFHQAITPQDVMVHQWQSDINITRTLSCLNFILLFTIQDEFVCLTLTKCGVIESIIKKPCSSLKDEYNELVQIENINGRIVMVAQKDNKVLFLQIQNDAFVITKTLDLTAIHCFKASYPLIVKGLMCWRRRRLYIPVAIMKRTFPEEDHVLSDAFSILEIHMDNFHIKSILQIESKVDIYQETVHLTLAQHGSVLLVRKEKKSLDGKNANVVSCHVVQLLPHTLKEASLAVIANQRTANVILHFNNAHFQRQIVESYDF
eukprot:TCONS_00067533-protein